MAQITAQMVKDLREMTGAGMMDCKAALGETSDAALAAQSAGQVGRVNTHGEGTANSEGR